MENVIRCHLCVTQWICRVVKAVQFFDPTHTHTHASETYFPRLLLLYSAGLALLEDPEMFFYIFMTAAEEPSTPRNHVSYFLPAAHCRLSAHK